MKIVINACYGGFGLSDRAISLLKEMGIDKNHNYIERDRPELISVVELLGPEASGRYADLKVVEIPDGVEWDIDEYDGLELVAEKHRTWS